MVAILSFRHELSNLASAGSECTPSLGKQILFFLGCWEIKGALYYCLRTCVFNESLSRLFRLDFNDDPIASLRICIGGACCYLRNCGGARLGFLIAERWEVHQPLSHPREGDGRARCGQLRLRWYLRGYTSYRMPECTSLSKGCQRTLRFDFGCRLPGLRCRSLHAAKRCR